MGGDETEFEDKSKEAAAVAERIKETIEKAEAASSGGSEKFRENAGGNFSSQDESSFSVGEQASTAAAEQQVSNEHQFPEKKNAHNSTESKQILSNEEQKTNMDIENNSFANNPENVDSSSMVDDRGEKFQENAGNVSSQDNSSFSAADQQDKVEQQRFEMADHFHEKNEEKINSSEEFQYHPADD